MSKEYKTEDQYDMIPLPDDELHAKLNSLSGWHHTSDIWIGREYIFDQYLDGVNFAKQIGEYAQMRMHHPSIKIDYKKVTIEISSWRAKGVTALDVEMAQDFNDIYEKSGDFA